MSSRKNMRFLVPEEFPILCWIQIGKINELKGIFTRREKERLGSVDTVQTVYQDGSVDFVDRNALGGARHQMPEGHFKSVQFVGTVVVSA